MGLNETWMTNATDVIFNSDFGFFGNLLPLALIFGISWGLVKKPRQMLFIQFPLVLAFKVFFPYFHISLVIGSFALFIMSIIGAKGDLLADVKEIPTKVRNSLTPAEVQFKRELQKIRDKSNSAKNRAQDYYDEMIKKGS